MKQLGLVGFLVAVIIASSANAWTAAAPDGALQVVAAADVNVPAGELELGEVNIPRRVMADGQPLAAGTYQVRLTAQSAQPEVVGQLTQLERWVEFRREDDVRGREVVSIVPAGEIGDVAAITPPRSGVRVEMLKENDYLRIWISRDGTHYLIHLPPA